MAVATRQGALRFSFTAGRMIAGQIKREVKQAAWSLGCEVQVEEDKGLLDVLMRFTITGDFEVLERLKLALEKYFNKIGG